MLMSSRAGAMSPVSRSSITYVNTERDSHVPVTQSGNYDSISFSAAVNKESRFHNELVSRLSQEVRTATTTGNVRSLHDEVSSGTYVPEPSSIASAIMFIREDA